MSASTEVLSVRPADTSTETGEKPNREEMDQLLAIRRTLCAIIKSPSGDAEEAETKYARPLQHLCRVLNRMNGLIGAEEFWREHAEFWEV